MRVAAILWDGQKKIQGYLAIRESDLLFELVDFNKSSLVLKLPLVDIESIALLRLFQSDINGIKITSKKGDTNDFVMEQPRKVLQSMKVFLPKL